MEKWLENTDIFLSSTYNEGKSVIIEMFIRILKAKIYKKKKKQIMIANIILVI